MKASELAGIIGAELIGPDTDIVSISPLENITEGGLVPLLGNKIPEEVYTSPAAAFLSAKGADTSRGGTYLLADDAELALVSAIYALYPVEPKPAGVDPAASVSDSAILAEDVSVGAFACVGRRASIGERTQIYPGAVIGEGAKIGADCIIYANVTIYDGCTIGDRVIIHSGTVIGSDGFGYYQKQGRNIKIPHIGSVVIENDVEIGSNSCVDKGKFSDTIIGEGTKIDNQVQVAHNVVIGRHNIMAGQAAISGSSSTGDYVMFGGRAATADHVKICSKVILGANSGVMSDVDKPGIYLGSPINNRKAYMREVALVRDLPEIVKRITELEKKVND